MKVTIDTSYKSLNKHHEELCGDKVEIINTDTSSIIILADGMGSGVKANILATLTSKILGTMLQNGASIEDCVHTVAKTLPVCQTRQVAYSTFSILQIFHNGEAYLVEFDNPSCIFIRNNKIVTIPYTEKNIENKSIREHRFHVELNDCFILMSDGAIHAGVGNTLNFGWTWESIAEYALTSTKSTFSSVRLANLLSKACEDLYMQLPGDDTTIAVARIIPEKVLNLFTGPPIDKKLDKALIEDFMEDCSTRIICGGTSANIASRILERELITSLNYTDETLPPIATMEGIDLVTEGVLTLSRTLTILKEYAENSITTSFFDELDKDNGGSKIAKYIIEDCTTLNLFVGRAINAAHQNPSLPYDLSIRMHLVEQLKETVMKMGKKVYVKYY
jgi:hypothetical protein